MKAPIQPGRAEQNASVERNDRTVRHAWLASHLFESIEPFFRRGHTLVMDRSAAAPRDGIKENHASEETRIGCITLLMSQPLKDLPTDQCITDEMNRPTAIVTVRALGLGAFIARLQARFIV